MTRSAAEPIAASMRQRRRISQVFELAGKREARIAAGTAEIESARWHRLALRLEIASETATAFLTVLSGQRRVRIYDTQIAALERILPQLQRRIEAGASYPVPTSFAEFLQAVSVGDLQLRKAVVVVHLRLVAVGAELGYRCAQGRRTACRSDRFQ